MPNLTLREIWGDMVLLHVTYPTMTKCVHTTTSDLEIVTDRMKHIFEHVVIGEWSSVPSLKDTTRCSAPEIFLNYPNCARINPNFAVAFVGFERKFLPVPHGPPDMNHAALHIQVIGVQSKQLTGPHSARPGQIEQNPVLALRLIHNPTDFLLSEPALLNIGDCGQ